MGPEVHSMKYVGEITDPVHKYIQFTEWKGISSTLRLFRD